jgi:hypothetical protein
MSRIRDRLESGGRDTFCQTVPRLDGDPPILLAPQDRRRTTDTPIIGIDFISIATVKLGNLLVERGLPNFTNPGPNVFE